MEGVLCILWPTAGGNETFVLRSNSCWFRRFYYGVNQTFEVVFIRMFLGLFVTLMIGNVFCSGSCSDT